MKGSEQRQAGRQELTDGTFLGIDEGLYQKLVARLHFRDIPEVKW